MKLLIFSFLIFLSLNSCKNKTDEIIFENFHNYVSKSDKVVINYHNKANPKDTRITRTIINASEIKKLRDLIKGSKKSEDCFHPTGMISFYKGQEEFVSLEFGLTPGCPSVYIYSEGEPMTYKITYQFGMFLDYIKQKADIK
jgi:hypothetical protein